jgi:hypothetical protein
MAKVRSLLLLTVVAATVFIGSPARAGVPIVRNPGEPSYDVELRGGRVGHTWVGAETVTFRNLDAAPLTDLYLRLWSNGVQGCSPLAIVVSNLDGGSAGALQQACTVLPVTLDTPVASGALGSLQMDVSITLPARNDRFGYAGGLAYVGTALPTLAIHDDAGWHLDPFIDLGESFYSVVGTYRVQLDVPKGLRTPTTGTATSSVTAGTRRTTTYVATDVRDFAWAAGRRLARLTASTAAGTTVRAWYLPAETSTTAAHRMLADALTAMNTFSNAFGTFPYPEMDVVLSAFTTFGGMEYPTIVFANPDTSTVSHELAHQWWYGVVGDDEFSEPWLDESFATWSERLPFAPQVGCRRFTWPSETARLDRNMAYWDSHTSEYWVIYDQGACMLANLAKLFGLNRFRQILHDYAASRWLGVARTGDFLAAVEAAAAVDLPGWDAAGYWARWRVGP